MFCGLILPWMEVFLRKIIEFFFYKHEYNKNVLVKDSGKSFYSQVN